MIAMLFSIGTAVAVALGLISRRRDLQNLAGITVFAFMASNAAVSVLGFDKAARAFVVVDAVCVACCFVVARTSMTARMMLVILGVQIASHAVAFLNGWEAGYNYYAMNNALYGLQLVLLGGTGLGRSLGDLARRLGADLGDPSRVRDLGR